MNLIERYIDRCRQRYKFICVQRQSESTGKTLYTIYVEDTWNFTILKGHKLNKKLFYMTLHAYMQMLDSYGLKFCFGSTSGEVLYYTVEECHKSIDIQKRLLMPRANEVNL